MARQKMLPGAQAEEFQDVIDAAEEYVEARDSRMAMGRTEKEKKAALMEAMKAHELTEYTFDGRQVVVLDKGEDVKVRKTKDAEEDEE